MFWENFVDLCAQKGVKPNQVTKALSLSTATATQWKHGSVPHDTTIKKIADYFGVPVSYFYDHNQSANSNNREALSPTDQIKKELFDCIEQMDEEQIKQLESYVAFMIERKQKS